ncbi:MAG: nucleoside deaminase [Proteobacteria bacterium]|nr:nucleoside deaminase [Pseudomonadota bacterium]MBU0967668.1 nucleoside deaminase [Pseudomonadota bacterium]
MTNHEHFMKQALQEARNALAENEFPVGCVLVCDNEVVARGRRLNSTAQSRNELDHAEIIALRYLFASRPDINPARLTAYCTMEPCLMCYAALLLSRIRTIVYAYEDAMGGGTGLSRTGLTPLYTQANIEVIPHVLRSESLALFKEFFQNPAHSYWQDSYLTQYTLSQS